MLNITNNPYVTLEQLVEVINSDPSGYGGDAEQIAGEYAYTAADESGYTVDEDAIRAHLEYLTAAGANFNEDEALKRALAQS
jgi:hypothetical protein